MGAGKELHLADVLGRDSLWECCTVTPWFLRVDPTGEKDGD
jgi:hypothetical protein